MLKKSFPFIFLLTACGHASQAVFENTFDLSEIPCQDFIQSINSFEPGPNAGFGQNFLPTIILGAPQGGGNENGGLDVVSLGDHGKIIVDTFPCEIVDQAGADFIVFENPFFIGNQENDPFAEPAIISISEDGKNFTPFPCLSDHYPYTGCAGWHPVFSNSQNGINPFDPDKAGGDVFDLADIGVAKARYIKIEDVSNGGFPPSKGFDLDAVAVVHGLTQQ